VRAPASAAALAAVVVLAGCGGGTAAPRSHLHLNPVEKRGKTLFIRYCGSCHTLHDAGTQALVGPDLDQPWEASRVRETITDGPGEMPADLVTGRAAAAVAAYVAAASGG